MDSVGQPVPDDHTMDRLFKTGDRLTLRQFLALMANLTGDVDAEGMRRALGALDTDDTGALDTSELRKALKAGPEGLTDAEVDEILKEHVRRGRLDIEAFSNQLPQ